MKLPRWLTNVSPLAARLASYRRELLLGDLVGGTVVAIMLVPQAMAYAMLAGLPPEVGLYASILPVLLYAVFGSSNYLAVGPVAMISLLVISGVGELAEPGSSEFISLCLTLAMLVGVFQILMAAFRFGFLVNFISHPVLIGFTSAAAIVIGVSQFKHLFGISIAKTESPIELILATLGSVGQTNPATLAVGLAACLVLLFFAFGLTPLLKRLAFSDYLANTLSKFGPLLAVLMGALSVGLLALDTTRSVAVVGEVPAGLPVLTWPDLSLSSVRSLLPLALIITLVGYLESYSVAKALAGREREKVDANRELFALGLADVGAAVTGGYPVTGGFSRSVVNRTAGVRTPLGSVVTALLVAASIAFLAPLFYYIPKSVLGAIIVVAVVSLIDLKTPWQLWKYSRTDAVALMVTFLAVIFAGIETGIFVGVVSTLIMLMWRTSRPHIAQVGRVSGSEHFRNIDRFDVQTTPGVIAIRVDESLSFANARYVESYVIDRVAGQPDIHTVLLIATGINDIDATGIEVLTAIRRELDQAGVRFCMSDVKGPVSDRLTAAGFDVDFINQDVFLSADLALQEITQGDQQRTVPKDETRAARVESADPAETSDPGLNDSPDTLPKQKFETHSQ